MSGPWNKMCNTKTLELLKVKWVSEFVKVYSMTLEQILAGYLLNPFGEEL